MAVLLASAAPLFAAVEDPNDPMVIAKRAQNAPRIIGETLEIGSQRELFCDSTIVNARLTTAERRLHHPEFVEEVLTLDKPWEGNACSYGSIVKDGDVYRVYYIANNSPMDAFASGKRDPSWDGIKICYAETKDGRNWVRPNLGLYEFNGSWDNNILIFADRKVNLDNQMVFKDENPECRPGEMFKAAIQYTPPETGVCGLWLFAADEPTKLRRLREIRRAYIDNVCIDTQNVIFWDSVRKVYHLYTRGYHRNYTDRNGDDNVRDIRHATSKDCVTWTDVEFLDFGPDAEDYSLYTSCISPYERAPHIFVGFPTRYVERKAWSPSFDRLPDPEVRKAKMVANPRYGLTLTDAIFMCSRDGRHFERYDEAFMSPACERKASWLYGDCYLYYGRMITPGRHGARDPELSFFSWRRYYDRGMTVLERYALRLDGFVSYYGDYAGKRVVTRRLKYVGEEMLLNFATSARGFIRVRIVEAGTGYEVLSSEIFGNATDRPIAFEKGSVGDLSGKPVTLEFDLSDAHVYSFRFQKNKTNK